VLLIRNNALTDNSPCYFVFFPYLAKIITQIIVYTLTCREYNILGEKLLKMWLVICYFLRTFCEKLLRLPNIMIICKFSPSSFSHSPLPNRITVQRELFVICLLVRKNSDWTKVLQRVLCRRCDPNRILSSFRADI